MPALVARALATVRPGMAAAAQALLVSVRGQWPIILYVIIFLGAAKAAVHLTPGAVNPAFKLFDLSVLLTSLPIILMSLVTVRFLRLALYVRPRHPTVALLRDIRDFLCSPARLLLGVPLMVLLSAFIQSFTVLKYNIPVFAPFSWDETFMLADKWLHFGRQPWEWLQPLLGHPPVTMALNVLYNMWFIVMWAFWMLLAFASRPSALRTQFFLSFLMLWSIGGCGLAILMSSAGPCYFTLLGLTPDPYDGLMNYLRQAHESYPIWALGTQTMLWDAYTGTDNTFGGISAMPSMHNASTFLFALAAWRINRRLGIVMYAYTFVIFIGSVHLGWHYAVDAYLAWILVLVLWIGTGLFARRHETTAWARDLDALSGALDPVSGESRKLKAM